MKLKFISIIIILLITLVTIADARHYSTLDKHSTIIHHAPQHVSHNYDSGSNPPPNRGNDEVTDFEIKGIGQYWNEEHEDE